MVKNLPAMQETPVQFPRSEDPWRRKWQPTPVFCLGNPIDRGAWWATVHGFEKNQMQYSSENYTQYLITYEGKESEKYIYIYVCVCVCVYTRMYIHIYTHTHIYVSLNHFAVHLKLILCKSTICQLKK